MEFHERPLYLPIKRAIFRGCEFDEMKGANLRGKLCCLDGSFWVLAMLHVIPNWKRQSFEPSDCWRSYRGNDQSKRRPLIRIRRLYIWRSFHRSFQCNRNHHDKKHVQKRSIKKISRNEVSDIERSKQVQKDKTRPDTCFWWKIRVNEKTAKLRHRIIWVLGHIWKDLIFL